MPTPIRTPSILTLLRQSLAAALCALPSLLLSVHAAAPKTDASKGDEVLTEMASAFKKGDKKRLTQLLPQARNHPLEPWAAYWELRARLSEASAREVQDFLTRNAGSYQEDRLRNDWLLLLGQRRDWSAFAAEYPNYRMRDDREVACYQLLIEHLQGGPTPVAQATGVVRRNWLAQREADDGCTLAADRLIEAKKLPPEIAWRKARLAMDTNRPRAASQAVAIVAPQALGQMQVIASGAAKYLSTAARETIATDKTGAIAQELALLALIRLATSDVETTAQLLNQKWAERLSTEQRNWVWGALGKQAALNLSSTALSYYAKVTQDSDLSDDMLGWKVRAALRASNPTHPNPRWPLVAQAINAMSEEARKDPAWIYWSARALLAQNPLPRPAVAASGPAGTLSNTPMAQALVLLESIAAPTGFYEMLALEELGRSINAPAKPTPLSTAEMLAAKQNVGLNRALYAILIGLRPEGVREWNYATNLVNSQGQSASLHGGLTDRELLAAAQFACDSQVWDRCINTSERTRSVIDLEQRYPLPFKDAVLKRSREIELDPAYVYGLIRQESRFIMDARSHVGASGLMQVMPATARWTAKKIGLVGFTGDQITRQDINIAIGTGYLKLVLDDFAGSLPLAAAAYNAGPGRPRKWRAPNEGGTTGPVLEAAIWAENVPFNETRDYVKKVLANTTLYAALITGQPQSLKARLGTIGPRDAGITVDRELP
ncbi:MAG: transglycosylase SLT domain-containing protein [Burkholderiales bacterium]